MFILFLNLQACDLLTYSAGSANQSGFWPLANVPITHIRNLKSYISLNQYQYDSNISNAKFNNKNEKRKYTNVHLSSY